MERREMTTKDDWQFRAEHLSDMADYLERKAEDLVSEARRYRGLAEQATFLARVDGGGWRPIDGAPKGQPVQVWAADKDHHWLPFTACLEAGGAWTRPASRDGLPFVPTHWRDLPAPPRDHQ